MYLLGGGFELPGAPLPGQPRPQVGICLRDVSTAESLRPPPPAPPSPSLGCQLLNAIVFRSGVQVAPPPSTCHRRSVPPSSPYTTIYAISAPNPHVAASFRPAGPQPPHPFPQPLQPSEMPHRPSPDWSPRGYEPSCHPSPCHLLSGGGWTLMDACARGLSYSSAALGFQPIGPTGRCHSPPDACCAASHPRPRAADHHRESPAGAL